jgi:hypothetical protein
LLAISFSQIRSIIVVLILVVSVIILKVVEAFLPRSVNIDLTLFVLIVLQKVYNLPLALTISIVSFLVGIIVRASFTSRMSMENLIFPPIGYIFVAFLISFLQFEFFITGMVAAVFYATSMTILFGLAYGFPIFDIIVFWITILPFNYWVFKTFGEIVLSSLS